MKHIFNCFKILIFSNIIGLLLLCIAFSLPVSKKNVLISADALSQESFHFRVGIWQLDNYTDTYMINHASFKKDGANLLDRVVNAYVFNYPDYSKGSFLIRYLNGDEGYSVHEYNRYWHGYLIFLKPLLIFLDYFEIRTLNMCVQVALFCYLCVLLNKAGLRRYIPVYVLIYYVLSPVATGFSMQYSSVYYISITTAILLLKKYDAIKNENKYIELFFLSGIFIVYFDYLTYPVFMLGFLLLTLLLCRISDDNDVSLIEQIKDMLAYSISWCFGYVLMWGSKWLISCIVNGSMNDLKNALNQVAFRAARQAYEKKVTAFDVILENVIQYKSLMFLIPTVVCVGYLLYKNRLVINNKNIINMLLCMFIALYPIVWYVAFKNHSYIHAWYTCRSLAISLGAVICGIMQLFTCHTKEII